MQRQRGPARQPGRGHQQPQVGVDRAGAHDLARVEQVVGVEGGLVSTVLPQATECVPHELLPIMPPSVQRLWVEGSGPKVRP